MNKVDSIWVPELDQISKERYKCNNRKKKRYSLIQRTEIKLGNQLRRLPAMTSPSIIRDLACRYIYCNRLKRKEECELRLTYTNMAFILAPG